MTDAFIFTGPSLPYPKIEEAFGCKIGDDRTMRMDGGKEIIFYPPAAEGDILKLVPQKPKIIGIIDGYFENVPSVWHKEILFAMSQGILVAGSSSMGALRAAELSHFGMHGIGAVYRYFADGVLEDDDEVTVVHGPAELGFPLFSEAMVNIRGTLEDAMGAGILTEAEKNILTHFAKQLHYKDRNYNRIFATAQEAGLDPAIIARLEEWVKTSRRDQKMIDAVDLVAALIKELAAPAIKKETFYTFESTHIWERSRSQY